MTKITPHIYIGNNIDMYNVLYGIGEHDVKAVLDCTSELPSSKWKRNKSIKLKKVGIEPTNRLDRSVVNRACLFIKEQLKNGSPVLIACKRDYARSYLILLSYFILGKNLTVNEAIEKINVSLPYSLDDENLMFVNKLVHNGSESKQPLR